MPTARNKSQARLTLKIRRRKNPCHATPGSASSYLLYRCTTSLGVNLILSELLPSSRMVNPYRGGRVFSSLQNAGAIAILPYRSQHFLACTISSCHEQVCTVPSLLQPQERTPHATSYTFPSHRYVSVPSAHFAALMQSISPPSPPEHMQPNYTWQV